MSKEHNEKFGMLGIVRIMELPSMRVISTLSKESGGNETFIEGKSTEWMKWEILAKSLGNDVYSAFGCSTVNCDNVNIKKIPDDFVNDTIFYDFIFDGGLFAVATCYGDKAGEAWELLKEWINENNLFSIDSFSTGGNRAEIYGTGITSDDVHKVLGATENVYQWDIFIPIRINE